jgi:hypothetical protein
MKVDLGEFYVCESDYCLTVNDLITHRNLCWENSLYSDDNNDRYTVNTLAYYVYLYYLRSYVCRKEH